MFTLEEVSRESFELSKVVKRRKIKESINFTEKDVADIQFFHADATIVSLNINNHNVHCV